MRAAVVWMHKQQQPPMRVADIRSRRIGAKAQDTQCFSFRHDSRHGIAVPTIAIGVIAVARRLPHLPIRLVGLGDAGRASQVFLQDGD
jgi:hypothetical protein